MIRFVIEQQDVEASTIALGVCHPIQALKEFCTTHVCQALLFKLNHPLLPCPAQLAVGFVASGIVAFAICQAVRTTDSLSKP